MNSAGKDTFKLGKDQTQDSGFWCKCIRFGLLILGTFIKGLTGAVTTLVKRLADNEIKRGSGF